MTTEPNLCDGAGMSVPVSEQTLIVRNFGPIESCELVVKPILCFIGPQASGKSTLSKLIYFCRTVLGDVTEYLLKILEGNDARFDQEALAKRIRARFDATFGPVRPHYGARIEFRYNEDAWIVFSQNNPTSPYFDPQFSDSIIRELSNTVDESRERFPASPRTSRRAPSNIASNQLIEPRQQYVEEQCNKLFSFRRGVFFIPAGRSLISTLSEQLQNVDSKLLDEPMRLFIQTVNRVKSFFSSSLEDAWARYQAIESQVGPDSLVQEAIRVISLILKGSYEQEGSAGSIRFAPNESVKINFSSSGQQESLWLLLWLFGTAMDGNPDHLFLEEPEAHLFPDAQRQLVELFVRMHNELGCQFTITTHSPYILSSLNNLLHAYRVGQKHPEQAAEVVAKEYWLDPSHAGGFFMTHAGMEPLLDPELGIYKVELIDSASRKLAEDYDRLASIEFSGEGNNRGA